MVNPKILIYDGSFNGFLTAVFTAFNERIPVSDIQSNAIKQNGLFSETRTIFTEMDKAKRVWNAIQNKNNLLVRTVYFAFLSGHEGIEELLYRYIKKLFLPGIEETSTMEVIIHKINQLATCVDREKEHLERSLGFHLTNDEVYFATINPDFDVLPLLSKYFRYRFKEQAWVIYDKKRKYGLYYDLNGVEIISLDLPFSRKTTRFQNGPAAIHRNRNKDTNDHEIDRLNIRGCIQRKLYTQIAPKQQMQFADQKKAG